MIHAVLDSGAGCSIVDLGSLERIGMQHYIKRGNNVLINASGYQMDILGIVKIPTRIGNANLIVHEFKVLNSRTYSNILIGRDYMQLFDRITFDFNRNFVQLGNSWVKCVTMDNKNTVRVNESTIVKARTEQIIDVRCDK